MRHQIIYPSSVENHFQLVIDYGNGEKTMKMITEEEKESLKSNGLCFETDSAYKKHLKDTADNFLINQLKSERNTRLTESDWIISKATEKGKTVSEEWKTYRQSLRDLPLTNLTLALDDFGELTGVTWPEKPKEAE